MENWKIGVTWAGLCSFLVLLAVGEWRLMAVRPVDGIVTWQGSLAAGVDEIPDIEAPEARDLGGESLEAIYVITLPECLRVAGLTYRDFKTTPTHRESHPTWVALGGLMEDFTPVWIKGYAMGQMRTDIVFTVGTRQNEENRRLVRALKQGFEERLQIAKTPKP